MLALLLVALAAPADSLVVTPDWLAAHRSDPGLVILHVAMDRADYERGHIPGARWVNPHDLITMGPPGSELPSAEQIDSVLSGLGVEPGSRIVYYGDTWMSPRVFLALEYVGLGDRASWLDGGLPAWRRQQRPLSTASETWKPGHVTGRAHPEIVIDADALRGALENPRLLVLDGRSPGEYSGADHSEGLPRSGHLPGAVNLPWEQTFTDPAGALDGSPSPLLSRDALLRLFSDAGFKDGRDLVTYCTVGLRAAHLYFIARYLGWKPRLYDGSMSEWSRRPELPMVSGTNPR